MLDVVVVEEVSSVICECPATSAPSANLSNQDQGYASKFGGVSAKEVAGIVLAKRLAANREWPRRAEMEGSAYSTQTSKPVSLV